MRLIDADELKKHKYHSDITHENAVSVAQIDWMPTVCDIDAIRQEIAEYKDDKVIHAEINEFVDIVLEIIDKHMKGEQE